MFKTMKPIALGVATLSLLFNTTPILADDSTASTPYDLTFTESGLRGSNLADLAADAAYWYADDFSTYKDADYAFISDSVFTGVTISAGTLSEEVLATAVNDVKLIEINIQLRYLLEGFEEVMTELVNNDGPMMTPHGVDLYVNTSHSGLLEGRYREAEAYIEKFYLGENEQVDQTAKIKVIMDEDLYNSSSIIQENATILVSAEDAITLREAILSYVSDELGGSVTDAYSNPFGDYRVVNATFADLTYDADADEYTYSLAEPVGEGEIAWVYVYEDQLRSKLQGIIGNTLYRGGFKATINDAATEDNCLESRYGVWVPITEQSGTFTLRYDEKVGNTVNLMMAAIGISTVAMIILVFSMTRGRKRSSYRYRG